MDPWLLILILFIDRYTIYCKLSYIKNRLKELEDIDKQNKETIRSKQMEIDALKA